MDKKGIFHNEMVPEMYTEYSLMSPEEVLKLTIKPQKQYPYHISYEEMDKLDEIDNKNTKKL